MAADDPPVAIVALRVTVVAQAVRGVLRASGWRVEVPSVSLRHLPHIIDNTLSPSTPDHTVLVCSSTPVGCATALRRLTGGEIGAIVPDDQLGSIPEVLAALRHRRTLLELDVIDRASLVPELDARQQAVLEALLAGQSAREIAASAYLSHATVKRALSQLLRSFGVRSGLQLARRAAALGYQARAATGPIP